MKLPSAPGRKAAISPARLAAQAILLRTETQSSYASELLHGQLTHQLDARDAGLCTELVMGCLRWQNQLDFAIRQFAGARTTKIDPEVLVALRLGAYQLLHLTRIPAHAAISESVELVKRARKTSASGLVNAILRRISESLGKLGLQYAEGNSPHSSAIALGHPEWLLQRWIDRFGEARAATLARSNNQPAVTYLRIAGAHGQAAIIQALANAGVQSAPAALLKECLVVQTGDTTRSSLFQNGDVAIQDQASQMVPLLLNVEPGQRVLDLCAAPGNKSAMLAKAARSRGMVIAGDIHLHRLATWAARPVPAGVAPVHRVVMDASRPLPLQSQFERILVDAPCSGTGTLRRNPEIKWRLRPESLAELAQMQRRLLQQAASVVAPGGRVVYSTCSLEPEENQEVVARFLSEHTEFGLLPVKDEAARLRKYFVEPDGELVQELLSNDYLETSPEKHNTDGFFAAILRKKI